MNLSKILFFSFLLFLANHKAFAVREFDIPLVEFIAKMNDYDPEKNRIGDLDQLHAMVVGQQISPLRLKRTQQMVQALAEYQFATELTLRELIANGIDAYYYDDKLARLDIEQKKVMVHADAKIGSLEVTDNGVGMGFHSLAYYLLTPTRSKNSAIISPDSAIEGVTGRFGQGFFAVMSFLKVPTDRVIVSSKTEKGTAVEIELRRDKTQFVIKFKYSNKPDRGTKIYIKSESLKNEPNAEQIAANIVPRYFKYNQRAAIYLDSARVNTTQDLQKIIIDMDEIKMPIYSTNTGVEEGSSTLSIAVNGILIKDFVFNGSNLWSKVAIDLPSTTALTADRGTLDFSNVENKNYITAAALDAFWLSDYKLFNTIYPLLKSDYFAHESPFINIKLPAFITPAVKEAAVVTKIRDQQSLVDAGRIDADLFMQAETNLLGQHVPPATQIISSTFKDPDLRAQIVSVGAKKLVFLEDRIDIANMTTLPLVNILYQLERKKLGEENLSTLFSANDLRRLQRPQAKKKEQGAAITVEDFYSGITEDEKIAVNKNELDQLASVFGYSEYTELIFSILYKVVITTYKPTDNYPLDRHLHHMYGLFLGQEENLEQNLDFLATLKRDPSSIAHLSEAATKIAQLMFEQFARGFDQYTGTSFGLKFRDAVIELNKSLKDIAHNALDKDIEEYSSFYDDIWKQINIKVPVFVDFGDSQAINRIRSYVDICRDEKLSRCEELVGFYYFFIYRSFGDATPAEEIGKYLLYLSKLNFQKLGIPTKAWLEFEHGHLVSLPADFLEKNRNGIRLLSRFYFEFCDNLGIGDELEKARKSCLNVLPVLLDDIVKNRLKADDLERFIDNLPSDYMLPRWVKRRAAATNKSAADVIFSGLEEAFMGAEMLPYVYPILFGDSVKFLAERVSFAGDEIVNQLSAIAGRPKVQEIMGADQVLINKNYKTAAEQSFLPYAWIKEVVKNAFEAGSLDFHVNVNTDTQNRLLVELRDHGSGVPAEDMYFFYIPGLTSKPRDTNDINFGWGFFTIFKDFDEICVESSTDGIEISKILLRKDSKDRFYLASLDHIKADGFEQGTKISLRRSLKEASRIEPVQVKANLLRFVQGFPKLKVFFNEEPLGERASGALEGEPLATVRIAKDQEIRIFSQAQGGIFYNGLAHSSSVASYINELPVEVQKLINKLPKRFAINFSGVFKQNAGRTGFIEESMFKDRINRAFQEAVFKEIALANADKPELFKGLLPYDFYYEFRTGLDYAPTVRTVTQKLADNKNAMLSEVLKEAKDFGAFMVSLPVAQTSSFTLMELKEQIKQMLITKRILKRNGSYKSGVSLDAGELSKEIGRADLAALIGWFENQIRRQIAIMKNQKNDVADEEFKNDFAVDNIPDRYKSRADAMKIFNVFFRKICQTYLNKNIDIWFYDAADASGAHARGAQTDASRTIAYNLRGGYFDSFERMLKQKTWDHDVFLSIVSVMTHELVHTYERIGESTHDRAFFEKQQKFLQPFFAITDEDVQRWKDELEAVH